jgi:hypothetical protein
LFFACNAVSSGEAAWILQGFDINYFHPAVTILRVHLEGHDKLTFSPEDDINATLQKSTTDLIRYFRRPLHGDFNDLLYEQYFSQYIRNAPRKTPGIFFTDEDGCRVYQRTTILIALMQRVDPHQIELFALRRILAHVSARSFHQALHGCTTFTEAARNLGLLANEEESVWATVLEDYRDRVMPPAELQKTILCDHNEGR